MESARSFVLDDLESDWIFSSKGGLNRTRIKEYIKKYLNVDALRPRGVLISTSDPVEFCAAFFAAVIEGIPVILANPNWGKYEWKAVFQQLDPGYLIGDVLEVEKQKISQPISAGSILIPTGGTTGGVKFAIHSLKSLICSSIGLQAFLGGGPIHSLCSLPLFHVSGLMQVVRSFITGGSIRFVENDQLLHELSVSDDLSEICISLVPTQLRRALECPDSSNTLKTCRAILLGGSSLPLELKNEIIRKKLPAIYGYGMTETAAMVAAIPKFEFLEDSHLGAVSLPHAEVDIVDEFGQLCRANERGRIRIRSDALFSGYWAHDQEDLTVGFLTNDEGLMDGTGRIKVIGRLDTLINTGGEKVDPAEIESAICRLPGVSEAFVIGYPDPVWGHSVTAFVVVDETVEIHRLRTILKRNLVPYKVPKRLYSVSKLPFNKSGKPDWARITLLLQKSCTVDSCEQPPNYE